MAKKDYSTELDKLEFIKDEQKLVTPIIETHCHLDYLKSDGEVEKVISKSLKLGIEKLITISVSPNNLDTAFNLAKNYSSVFCSQGIHPHEAKDWNNEVEKKITERFDHEKVIAVGEIGLDYYYNNSPRDQQISAFEAQLDLAKDTGLPVIIHTREAEEDTKAILKNFQGKIKKGVIHSFTSSIELAEFALSENYHLGFNGIISFKTAENVRDVLKITPIEKILLETDSPFLTPVPFRGKENAPYYLPFVAKAMIETLKLPYKKTLETIYQNSKQLFGI